MQWHMKAPDFLLLILLLCMFTVLISQNDKVRLSSVAEDIFHSQLENTKMAATRSHRKTTNVM